MAKNDFKRPMSLALATVLATSMVPAQVFAEEPVGTGSNSEQTQVIASAALAYSNGYYDITTANMTKEDGYVLYYKSGTDVAKWEKDKIAALDPTGLAVMYAAADSAPAHDDEGWVEVTVPSGVTAINNKEVADALNNFATTITIPDLATFSDIIADLETELGRTITNTTQLGYVKDIVEGYYKNVNAQYIIAENIANNVSSFTTNDAISTAYNKVAAAISAVNTATASTFKEDVLEYLANVKLSIDSQKEAAGIMTELESNVLNLFGTFYSKSVAYPVSNIIIDNNNNHIKISFIQSAGVGAVKKGDLEYWLQHDVLAYIQEVDSTWRNKNFVVEVSMPTSTGVTTAAFDYTSGYNALFSPEKMEELEDSISVNFEYLTFNHTLAYVGSSVYDNDTAGHGTNTGNTIIVIADGEFSRSDSDWTSKDTMDFIDWYTYEIAEPIVNQTGKNVKILFYDENDYIMTAATVTAASLGGQSGNATFTNIQNMLNSEFDEYEGLDFSYTVSGTSKTLNINMKGTNFRERYDSWQNLDRAAFDNWVNKSVILSALTYQDSDVRVKVYDKNDVLLDTFEVEYDEVAEDIEDVEDYLNDNFYTWNGIYWDFDLSMGGSGVTINAEGDFKTSDDEWKNITDAELKDWTDEIALYVIESIPRNLTINIQNKYGATVDSFSYLRAGFAESLAFQNQLNDGGLNYEGIDFTADVTYNTGNISIRLDSTDFDRTDTVWKNMKNSRDFKSWLEDTIVSPAVAEFGKGVTITVYDEDEYQCGYYSYSKSFESSSTTSASTISKALNNYLRYMDPAASSKVSATHTVTLDGKDTIKVKTKLSTSATADNWTARDTFQYNRFISLIMARAGWGNKNVELTVVDKSGKTLNSYTSSQFTSTEYTNGIKKYTGSYYAPGSGYIHLKEDLYKRSNYEYDINNQLVEYLRDLGETAKYKIILDCSEGVDIKIDKSAASALHGGGYTLLLDNKDFATLVDGSKMNSVDYKLSYKKAYNTVDNNLYMASKYTLTSDNPVYVSFDSHTTKGNVYNYTNNTWTLSVYNNKSVKDVTAGIGLAAINFTDIASSPYQDSIRKLSAYGIMNGTGNNMFSPKLMLTRAQACQIIINGLAPTTTPSGYFSDVPYGTWYYDAIMKAASLGIVSGYGNNVFGPNDKVTYDQFLMILQRTGTALGYTAPYGEYVSTSGLDSASWAIDNTAAMIGLGVVDRYGYKGDQQISREDAADMTCKYLVAIGYIN